MAFLHCHNCDWQQDDFWDHQYYNPVKCLGSDEQTLLYADLEKEVDMDPVWLKENGYDRNLTERELVVHHFKQLIKRIENMKYRTMEEYKKLNPEGICPQCGKKELDID